MIAMLVANGQTNVQIAAIVGMHPNRIGTITGSPLFQALVREYQRELLNKLADITERLHAEAMPTLNKLVALRDTGAKEEVQLGAANSIADRIPALAKKVKHEEEKTLRILFGHDVEAILEAVSEDRGEPYQRRLSAATAETTFPVPTKIVAVPLDQLIDSLTVEEPAA
jgi:hypothetical protein